MAVRKKPHREVALIFVEGDTEMEFYGKLAESYLRGISKSILNLHGIYNVHRNVLGKTEAFLHQHSDATVRIYCCIDRESRDHNPPLDIVELRSTLKERKDFKRVLSADAIIATQMIESWFFHDIDGIYKFLKVPHALRNPTKFTPPKKFTHLDLSKLFARFGKTYIKGRKCANFINHLDLGKIYGNCRELSVGLNLIIGQAQ
jgi:hypothetical protein